VLIHQGYIIAQPDKSVRIRISGDVACITIKGKTVGASRPEFEYPIPLNEALEMLEKLAGAIIRKIRHEVTVAGDCWVVDEFLDRHEGLFLAEIELKNEEQHYEMPDWVLENVTTRPEFSNAYLATHPLK
ncbi:MAG: CYTH domain-containing protein, partial [Bacteroidota bacterium]